MARGGRLYRSQRDCFVTVFLAMTVGATCFVKVFLTMTVGEMFDNAFFVMACCIQPRLS